MKSRLTGLKTILLSLIVMAFWGSLYPCIKVGYKAFAIDSTNIPSILMFAGTRFALCGVIICVIALIKKDKIETPKKKSIGIILLVGLFSIVLHYAFLYIGISTTDSSKTALIKQLGSLLYVCFAFLFIKGETFNAWKIVGAIVGFLGIIAINVNGSGVSFSSGNILIVVASVCTVIANILIKKIAKNNYPFWITGISQFVGGIILIIASLVMGGTMLTFNGKAFGVFAYICSASMAGYILWNYILKTSDLSNMFIIKFAEPLFACIVSAIILKENIFQWQYLVAFVLISIGIIIGNQKKIVDKEKNM